MRRWQSLPRHGGVKSIALEKNMWMVYILQSKINHKYYVGCTSDIERRLLEHNSGYNKSTSNNIPYELIYFEEYENQQEAFSREKKIKSYKFGNAFKKLIVK